MEPINLTTQDYFLYALLINVGLGFLFGLLPLVVGFVKHQRKYAFWGFILCIVGGAILGLLLAIPIAAIFTWLIFSRSGKTESVQTGDSASS